ncbi:hypothetical protein D1B33_12425 [Lysinibacillus yapensis]|uniref:Uncharacterized protein n=1 Tax=Ureibacillus yapensis TaxID=2304605 RepID=A0A396SDK6_9BACL|nr:hypothetical protein [Lysinibacillus yapensis]RHW35894.1 hypothetical protein D1B33_12425 [Lysinibacillus yapensis]
MPSSKNINKAFEKVELKGLALDAYLTNQLPGVRKVAEEEFTYGYKKVRADGSFTNKFATLMILRGFPALVLHIGKRTDKEGLRMQEDVDRILNRAYERNANQMEEKAHEVFIRLDWVNNLNDLKPFIDKVYEKRD